MKGWSGFLALILTAVLMVSGIIFGGIEYYRLHPFEPEEQQNFLNMMLLASLPAWGFLIFKHILLKIREREVALDFKRRFPDDFAASSPIGEAQKSGADPLPPLSQNPVNGGGINQFSGNQSGVVGTAEDIQYAVRSFISLNGGLNFKDQSSIARIVGTVIREVTKGEVDQTLFRMVQSGILISKEGVLYLNSQGNMQENQQKAEEFPVSEVTKIEKEQLSVTDAQRITAITRLLTEFYGKDKREFQFQYKMITEFIAKGLSTYKEVLSALLEEKTQRDARARAEKLHQEKQKRYEEHKKQRELEAAELSDPDRQGTQSEFAGTVSGQSDNFSMTEEDES